jgi:hypothetical protein
MMPKLPDDLIDPAEGPLARRVGAWTDQVVFPIDPVAIAASASAAARRRTLAQRLFGSSGAAARLALIGGAAVLAVAGAGFVVTGGAARLFAPAPTQPVAVVVMRSCTPDDVDAVIVGWDGAAGHRIASVELHQIGTTACSVAPRPEPWLADGDGRALITGHAFSGGTRIEINPGDVLHTLVQAGNYCGADPVAPVTVAFTEADQGTFVATALSPTDLTGVPPCSGTAGPKDDIQMQPWSRGPAAS